MPPAEVEFRLIQQDPTPRASLAEIEGTAELRAQAAGRAGMRHGGPRLRHERPVDQLRDYAVGSGEHVVVRRATLRGIAHDFSIAGQINASTC
ncbi:MAG: hypothetical protein WBY94_26270 [Polyangiaceae bacterium]